MIRELVVYLVASSSLAVAQVQLQFPCYGCTFNRALQLANGNQLLVGSRLETNNAGLSAIAGIPAQPQIKIYTQYVGAAPFGSVVKGAVVTTFRKPRQLIH
jgi:hypothetical protein